jgi:CubicO group peptidase (beta-lactamase class C family)
VNELGDAARRAAAVVQSAVADGLLPAAAFGVADAHTGIVLAEAYGTARLDSPFCLASTTKPIATTVLGSLVDDGLVSLDTPILELVPEMPAPLVPGRAATVRDVAAHTAGLGVHHRFFYADEREAVPVLDAVRLLARPVFPVGAQWRYSNLGYGVLQVALERAAGRSMAELVDERVCRPLGLADVGWGEPLGPVGAVARHLSADETYPGYVTDHPPASEAWCSIGDLLQFGLAHARRSLLRPATHDLLAQPAAPLQPDGAAYALGWVTRHYGGHRVLVHGGRMGGVGAHLVVVPSFGLVVAGLANIETERLAEAVGVVLHQMVPGYAPPAPQPPWTAGAAHETMRRRWSGVLQLGDDALPAVLDASGERITLSVAGATTDLVMPHVQPAMVAGHANLAIDHPLAPVGALCHLDAVPLGDDGGAGGVAAGDVLVGGLTLAQYPGGGRRRQGDAVTAGLHLVAD